MKELRNSIAQFAAVIMILITFAVTSAAVAQWAGDSSQNNAGATSNASLLATAR